MRRKDYACAQACFEELIKKKKHLDEAWFNLGKCHFKMGDIAEARNNFHHALDAGAAGETLTGILEVTNWRMLSSHHFFNGWPVFSPDGASIAFTSARRDTNDDGKITGSDCGGIYIVEIVSGAERCIADDHAFNAQPFFSPDGKYIAYLSARQASQPLRPPDHRDPLQLFIYDLETGQERQLLDNDFHVKHFSFTPDGQRIVFSGWGFGDVKSAVYSVDIQTRKIKTMVSSVFENTFPSVSADGRYLVYSSWRRDTNGDGVVDFHDNSCICVKDLETGFEHVIAPDKFNNTFPRFTPDGKSVVYLSVRDDTNKDGKINGLDNAAIYCYDLADKTERCLVDDRFFNKFACFTPDGKRLLFVSNWRLERADYEKDCFFEYKGVYMLELSSGQIFQVVSDKMYGNRSLVVSPQGNRVAYVSWREGTGRGLYMAYLNRLPNADELHQWIDRNLE